MAGTSSERTGHVRGVQAASQDHRDLRGDGARKLDRRSLTRPAQSQRVARVEQDGLQVGLSGISVGLSDQGIDGRLRPVARLGGRDMQHLQDRQRDPVEVSRALMTVQLDGVKTEAGGDGGDLPCRTVGEDADDERTIARGGGCAGRGDERGRLVLVETALRARHEVEPDRVRPGLDGRGEAGRLGDAADLDEGRAAVRGGIDARAWDRASRHEPGDPRLDVREIAPSPHEDLADESCVESDGSPAAQRRRITDARFGDHEAVVRDEVPKPDRQLGVHLERPQVAVVDTDEPSTRIDGSAQLLLGVGLHERLQAHVQRQRGQARQRPRPMVCRQQQDRVSAGRAEERQLPGVHHELLGQDREAGG